MFIGLSLIALALGYRTFIDGSRETKGRYHSLGRMLGIYIMLISFSASAFTILKYCKYFNTNHTISHFYPKK